MAKLPVAVLAVMVATSAALRCHEDWQCGERGICDTLMSCCSVRGCPNGCPAGQACVAIGYPRCGKFSKLADTCACPRKHGCVPLRHIITEVLFKEEPRPLVRPVLMTVVLSEQASEVEDLTKTVYEVIRDEPAAVGVTEPPQPVPQENPAHQPAGAQEETQHQRPESQQRQEEDQTEEPREWLDIFYDLQH